LRIESDRTIENSFFYRLFQPIIRTMNTFANQFNESMNQEINVVEFQIQIF